jgi:hypothetical protein
LALAATPTAARAATGDVTGSIATGGTVERAAGVAGVTNPSIGTYTVTLSAAQPDALYPVVVSPVIAAIRTHFLSARTTTSFTVQFVNSTNTAANSGFTFNITG